MDDRRFDNLTRLAATASRRRLLQAIVGAAGGGLLSLVGVRSAAARSCFAGGPDCAGCCAKQFCRAGNTPQECGAGGAPCRACADDEECRNGTCAAKAACDEVTCPDGCCPSTLHSLVFDGCQPGTRRLQCGGPGGATCDTCDEDEFCLNRQCVECDGGTCAGCCDRTGELGVECEPGTTRERCGARGRDCQRCATGERCVGGQCVACDASNCRGCCTPDGTCEAGDSPRVCGVNGRPCMECPPRQACINGECKPCDAETCPDGCCLGGLFPSCVTPPSDKFCGRDGQQCYPCQEGSICVDGGCRCDPERCAAKNGCCEEFFCWDGDDQSSCGAGGQPCVNCGAGGMCVNRVCRCDPEFCEAIEGCCGGDRCQPGDTDEYCGTDGGDCVACAPGQSCRAGRCVCDPARCPGCCRGGDCRTGNDPTACGRGGSICTVCEPGQLCQDGQCVSCRENCDGCCDGQFCRPGTERTACGAGGEQCEECDWQSTEKCVNGRCTTTCGEATCPDGCCSFGECGFGTSDIACGTDGEPCQNCRQRGQSCRNQVCAGEGKLVQGCGSDTCDTCCDGETCVEETGDDACGAGGGECQDCAAAGGRCADGACVCDQSSCPDGCCEGETCQGGDEDTACGRNGESCENCAAAGGRCVNNMCAVPGSCPEGCADADGNCREGTSPDACGPKGGACQACQAGEQCDGGSCVRRVGSRPVSQPDLPYAAVRPTDLLSEDAARAVVGPGAFYVGTDAGLASGALSPELTAAFGGAAAGAGYQQTVGLPASGESAAGWDRIFTTWSQFFDGSDVNLTGEVIPNIFAGYLANTTPLLADPTIGDGAFFHGWSGQTSDGASFSSTIGVASTGPMLSTVRVDDYTGASPDVTEIQRLMSELIRRAAEIWEETYRNLGTEATALPFGEDPRQWSFNGRYTAYDGVRFRPSSQDAAAFARDQERFSEIDRGYGLVQPIGIDEDEDGPVFAFYATTTDRFTSGEAAQTHFGQLDAYLAEDGAAEGFTAIRQPDEPEFPDIITPPNAYLWHYQRQTERGTLPGAQIAFLTEDELVKINAFGAFPLPPDGQPAAEYQAAMDDVVMAAAIEHLAGAFEEEIPPALGSAVGRWVDMERACLAGESERCIEAGPVVTTNEQATTGTTAGVGPFDLAAAVVSPVAAAATFGVDPESIQAGPGLTFTGIDNAAAAGFTLLEEIAPRIGVTEALRGHTWQTFLRRNSPIARLFGLNIEDDVDKWILDQIRERLFAELDEAPNDLDIGDEVRLFEGSGESATGASYFSHIAVVQWGSLTGMLQLDVNTDSESEPTFRLWDPNLVASSAGPIADPADVPLVQIFADGLAKIQEPGYEDLSRSFPDYTAPGGGSNLLLSAGFQSSDLVIGGVRQEDYTVVDSQTIRQAAQTDEQHANHVKWNANVVRAVQRVEILLGGASAVFGSNTTSSGGSGAPVLALGRAIARYTSEAAAAEGLATIEQRVDEAAALEPNLQVVPDDETESPLFGVDYKWVRYLRSDDTGQRAGVGLYLGYDDQVVSFDVFSSFTLPPEEGFSESFAVEVLYGTAEIMAFDHLRHNDRDLGQIDQNVDAAAEALFNAFQTYQFSGGDATVARPPIAEALEASEPSPEGCPPGWVFDAAGPSGAACYRCSYPNLSGTVYSVEAHGCVRNGEETDGEPREVLL